ncbi:MAG: hypothetical protein OXE52_10570 [Chloroflexi bacterium]|nr:hypothetical protein [Chloroflexota bacterium]
MIFQDILKAVAELDEEERQLLRRYLEPTSEKPYVLTPEERMQRLNAALDEMGEGLSQVQLQEMTAAMTEKYIEAWDETEWIQ